MFVQHQFIRSHLAHLLIISQYLQINAFFPQAADRVFYRRIRQISFKVDKEAVFPVLPFYRPGFDPGHVQVIIYEMRQQVVQRAALMRQFEADADLLRIFQEDLLVGDHDESGGIPMIIIDIIRQHRQAMHLGRIGAAHGRLGLILLI